jgi:hypothetical protein
MTASIKLYLAWITKAISGTCQDATQLCTLCRGELLLDFALYVD